MKKLAIGNDHVAVEMKKELVKYLTAVYPNIHVDVVEVTNDFFGPQITVSGLLTGQDIVAQLKNRTLGSELLLPVNVLRSGEDVLLDDMHINEIEKTLQVPVRIVQSNGNDLFDALVSQGIEINGIEGE